MKNNCIFKKKNPRRVVLRMFLCLFNDLIEDSWIFICLCIQSIAIGCFGYYEEIPASQRYVVGKKGGF